MAWPLACGQDAHIESASTLWGVAMMTFVLWLLLFVVSWPLALLALVAYPIVWLVLLPFRLIGIAVGGVFQFLHALLTLPARALRRLA
jgi:hypothetical protein